MQTEYKRLSDESRDDYIWRICQNKDIGKYDLTWSDVAEILNEELTEDYTESKYRKRFADMKKGYERAVKESTDANDMIEEMRLQKLELEMERKKKQTESVYYNRVLREHSREEMLKERVEQAIKNADKIPLPEFKPLEVNKVSDKEYLLVISDIHAYKMFKSITNEYSKAILEDRMAKLLFNMKELVEQEGIDKITVLNGGDNFEGLLRNSALAMLEIGVMDTVIEFRKFMAKWISDLSAVVNVKYVHLTSANHGEIRLLNMRAGQMPQDDFEKDVAHYIHDILENNDRIEVVVPDNPYYHLKIAGKDYLCHHGHGIKSPKKYLDSMSRKLKVFFDGLIIGHYHSEKIETVYEDVDGGDIEIIICPSVVGSDPYADSIHKGSKASALVMRFDEKYGRDREYKFVLN